MSSLPQQPYLLRAIYEWCVDSAYTPHISVLVDARTQVPQAYVKDGMIVLNIGPNAVRDLTIDNEWVSFSARFGGIAQEVFVPVENVLAIYARETGEGLVLRIPSPAAESTPEANGESPPSHATPTKEKTGDTPRPSGRPTLRVVK